MNSKLRRTLSRTKQTMLSAIANLLYFSGISLYLLRRRLANRVVVLMYHRIIPRDLTGDSYSNGSIVLDSSIFQRQLDFLQGHFDIISVHQLAERLQGGGQHRRPACVITFDDGWIDNYLYAYPELMRRGLPATIFLPVDYIGSDLLFWQERLSRQLNRLAEIHEPCAARWLQSQQLGELVRLSRPEREEAISEFITSLKNQPYEVIDQMLAETGSMAGKIESDHIDRYLDWAQVNEMAAGGIDFGSHCCSHRILTRLDDDIVAEELNRSAAIMESRIGIERFSVAYPNGNNGQREQDLANRAGYRIGFGTRSGLVDRSETVFDIRRLNVNERNTASLPMFLMVLLCLIR